MEILLPFLAIVIVIIATFYIFLASRILRISRTRFLIGSVGALLTLVGIFLLYLLERYNNGSEAIRILAESITVIGAVFLLLSAYELFKFAKRLQKLGKDIKSKSAAGTEIPIECDDELNKITEAVNPIITELKKAYESFHIIVEQSAKGIIVLDEEKNIVYINKAAKEILGRTLEQIKDQYFGEVFVGNKEFVELEVLQPDGSVRFVEARVTHSKWFDRPAQVVLLRDVTERKKVEEKIKYLSFHDALTGLYNRYFFEEELKRLNIQRKFPLTIVMADVNGLKLVNDILGHAQGDKHLRALSKILKSVSRKDDIVCRIGGDEFAIILPKSNENVARAFCDRVKNACKKYNKTAETKLSVALGYAVQTGQYKNIKMVLEQADKNMYLDKLLSHTSRREHDIEALRVALAIKDPYTAFHGERLQDLAEALGKDIGLSELELKGLRLLALFHDIGKLHIPNNVLFKPGKLTEEEWAIVKKHSEYGYEMAKNIPELSPIADDILYHHERWDGTGYPKGLKGEEIPISSRIISIVDAYNVMLIDRSYKKAMTKEEAIKELKRYAGTQFDPELVGRFLKILTSSSS